MASGPITSGQIDGKKVGKEADFGYMNSRFFCIPEYIMWNARLDEAQAGIKIARRNINNLRFANDTTLMAESKEELKSLLMKVKDQQKS